MNTKYQPDFSRVAFPSDLSKQVLQRQGEGKIAKGTLQNKIPLNKPNPHV